MKIAACRDDSVCRSVSFFAFRVKNVRHALHGLKIDGRRAGAISPDGHVQFYRQLLYAAIAAGIAKRCRDHTEYAGLCGHQPAVALVPF